MFEPFVRLEGSRSRETCGMGLGLAIARSTVGGQGGEMTLASRAGGGLMATVRLPLDALHWRPGRRTTHESRAAGG